MLRVSGKVELSRVPVTEGKIAANMGNPGEIDFCSSWCEVRVSEGWSYRDSTVYYINRKVTLGICSVYQSSFSNLVIESL